MSSNLPPRCYSDLLRDWAEYCVTDESYDETTKVLERILRLSVSKQALETGAQEDADDVVAFHEQKAAPPVETEGPILVAQADGKGVPMVRSGSAPQPARLSKGQKRTKKKEAVTTAIYTIEPYHRTPQDVVEALMHDREGDESAPQASSPPSPRPTPATKEVWATLEGKDIAFERLAQRDHGGIRRRVALTDGDDALQRQVGDTLPTFQLVLDIIRASEYLWDTANALWGETHAAS